MEKYILILVTLFILASCTEKSSIQTQNPNMSASGVILALGDSLTIGYRLPEADSYPAQLEKRLKDQ